MKQLIPSIGALQRALAGAVIAVLLFAATQAPAESEDPIADFVEPGFPFITSTVDAREIDSGASADNLTPRGVVLFLGNDTYATFDPDLLRMSVGWRGEFLSLTTMAQVSYREAGNKQNDIPRVLGDRVFSNGIYPGWDGADPAFEDPRPAGPNPADPGRGPLATDLGRWNGLYVVGDDAVLSYTVRGVDLLEQPGSLRSGDEVGIARTFRMGPVSTALTLVVAEVRNASRVSVEGNTALLFEGPEGDSVTAVGIADAPAGSRLEVDRDRYVTLRVPAGTPESTFRVVVWRGAPDARSHLKRMLAQPVEMADVESGGPPHWPGTVETSGEVAPDTSAYVVDRLTLPLPNPWKRNVRVADVDFFDDGRAAVVTFDGDVWIVGGIDRDLQELRWKRFASGMYEPLSISVVQGKVHVFGREGIVRLHDLNGDGEADFYENFSNLVVQSSESREFPLDMVATPDGGFLLAKGGALDAGPKTSPGVMPGFRAGSRHAGSVLKVSADGRRLHTFASGLREPFLGVHPELGIVTASDQQGNFVPSTPIYGVVQDGYYGVPATAHRTDLPTPARPLLWIPHSVDQSGAGQAWVTDDRMGFGEDALIHFSYGRPGAFRVYVDSTSGVEQGGLISLLRDYPAPLMKGQSNPRDGLLYMAGFQVWGTRAEQVSAFSRIRYTGRPSTLPRSVEIGRQGVLLRFEQPLDREAMTDVSRYAVKRWNYRRTEAYGSGHFTVDGDPGQERMPVAEAHVSTDGRSLLLLIPDMREVMQMEVVYDLRTAEGGVVTDSLYLTVNQVEDLDLDASGLANVDWRAGLKNVASVQSGDAVAASAEQGRELFQSLGCTACHSTDGSTEGKLGPTFRDLFGSRRTFTDGSTRTADEDYLRESIEEPGRRIVQGFAEGMPSYLGVLDEAGIESLILYIRSLSDAPSQ